MKKSPQTKRTTLSLSVVALRHIAKVQEEANRREGRTGPRKLSQGYIATCMLEAAPYLHADGTFVEPITTHPRCADLSAPRLWLFNALCRLACVAGKVRFSPMKCK